MMEKSLTEIILGIVTDSMRNDLEVYDAFFREAQNDEQIKELLDRYERSKWHDLRKDPEDMPKLDRRILICYVMAQEDLYITWWTKENDVFPMFIKPVAWKYIDRFVEAKDGKLGSN